MASKVRGRIYFQFMLVVIFSCAVLIAAAHSYVMQLHRSIYFLILLLLSKNVFYLSRIDYLMSGSKGSANLKWKQCLVQWFSSLLLSSKRSHVFLAVFTYSEI